MKRHQREMEAGFTLIEALAALAITGVVLTMLATITAQWLPAWSRGSERVQRAEMLGLALARIGEDLAAAEFVPAGRASKGPLFVGEELTATFVRTAVGPNAGRGLELVRIGEIVNGNALAVVRSRLPFAPMAPGAGDPTSARLADPVVLLPAPYRLAFAYTDRNLNWTPRWQASERLPYAVRITIRDTSRRGAAVLSSTVRIRIDAAAGACPDNDHDCANGAAPEAAREPSRDQAPARPAVSHSADYD